MSQIVVIYDNATLEHTLLEGLVRSLEEALQAGAGELSVSDGQAPSPIIPLRICTGYFHLYAWGTLRERLATASSPLYCHLLVGMHRPPEYEQTSQPSLFPDRQALKDKILKSLLAQVNQGIPTAEKESRLRFLIEDLDRKRLTVKAYLCNEPLHGKLYLIEKPSGDFRWLAYVGSSNFTLAGLEKQGELNVKITGRIHARELSKWFEDYWKKACSEDISQALLERLRQHTWVGYLESAKRTPVKPYHVYLRMAYLLAEKLIQASEVELSEQLTQGDFRLLEFQKLAVSQLIFLLEKRGGALLGDVVGLGKTFTASAVARTLFEQRGYAALVICPPALMPMWESYLHRFLIPGKVISMGAVQEELPRLYDRSYGLVIIDESHNLRNPESKRYEAIKAFIQGCSPKPKVLLLSATPYSKAFSDLGAQLQLFLQTQQPLGIRPLHLIKEWNIRSLGHFKQKYGFAWDTLAAFKESTHGRDWQELMQLFLVRRTRSYIKKNFAQRDKDGRYFILQGKERLYFPERVIKTIQYYLRPKSRYEALLSDKVIDMIDKCTLPRYGLAEYIREDAKRQNKENNKENKDEQLLGGLTRAGTQLRGFLKAALFKRLESSGYSFLLSLYRLILRNEVFLYAIKSGKPLPIGTIQVEENVPPSLMLDEDIRESDDWDGSLSILDKICALSENDQRAEAKKIYENLGESKQIKYIDLNYFDTARLQKDLESDNKTFRKILKMGCPWKPEEDEKLMELIKFIKREGSREKLIIFTQFADTAYYIGEALKLQLGKKEGKDFAVITSKEKDILTVVRRFSPRSNGGLPEGLSELPLLISTDVLSEGQNLQDARHLINYDLPWTVIEMVQRAGRIDRLGQQAEKVFIYSFLPAEKLDELLRLTERLIKRLEESGAVLGSDEKFFQEEQVKR
ncbi:MAG: helicase-related protein, partial [Candidatus Caldarchaeum sp.]